MKNGIFSCGTCGCNSDKKGCDVCRFPICGEPNLLSVYAPVVYDEVGINLCRTITIPADILADYPTVSCAQLEVLSVTFTEATETIPGTTVSTLNRANCVGITLTNVLITFNVKLFDGSCNYLTSFTVVANYLPGNEESIDFAFEDDCTNPTSAYLELYTPYGVSYEEGGETPIINVVALEEGSNSVTNGLNVSIVGKAMALNRVTGVFSAGISIIIRTVYYETFKFSHEGKTIPPKANLNGDVNNSCLEFVEGGLLIREIKPLELDAPNCERNLKEEEQSCCEAAGCFSTARNSCDVNDLNGCDTCGCNQCSNDVNE